MSSKPYYIEKHLEELQAKFKTIDGRTDDLLLKYMGHQFTNQRAKEFAYQGFCRRVQTLRRCVKRIFEVIPPETVIVPDRDRLYDAQINLQAFLANAFGAADNLAWIWAYEHNLADKIKHLQIGLRKKNTELRTSLPKECRSYLESIDEWFGYVTEYRDALAHRIPPYIPPGAVAQSNATAASELQEQMNAALNAVNPFEYERLAAEQAKLFFFYPMMTHSLQETAGVVYFHPQIIEDFGVVEEIALQILRALRNA
jgi:hypothetical protein